jgi:hypothetical protein
VTTEALQATWGEDPTVGLCFGTVSGARADAVTRGFAISWLTSESVLLRDTLLKLFLFLVAKVTSNPLPADLSTEALAQLCLSVNAYSRPTIWFNACSNVNTQGKTESELE